MDPSAAALPSVSKCTQGSMCQLSEQLPAAGVTVLLTTSSRALSECYVLNEVSVSRNPLGQGHKLTDANVWVQSCAHLTLDFQGEMVHTH